MIKLEEKDNANWLSNLKLLHFLLHVCHSLAGRKQNVSAYLHTKKNTCVVYLQTHLSILSALEMYPVISVHYIRARQKKTEFLKDAWMSLCCFLPCKWHERTLLPFDVGVDKILDQHHSTHSSSHTHRHTHLWRAKNSTNWCAFTPNIAQHIKCSHNLAVWLDSWLETKQKQKLFVTQMSTPTCGCGWRQILDQDYSTPLIVPQA